MIKMKLLKLFLVVSLFGAVACADVSSEDPSTDDQGAAEPTVTDEADAGAEETAAVAEEVIEAPSISVEGVAGPVDGRPQPKAGGAGLKVSWSATYYLLNDRTWPVANCSGSLTNGGTTPTLFSGGTWQWNGIGMVVGSCDGKYTLDPIRFEFVDNTTVKMLITSKLYANQEGTLRKTSSVLSRSLFIPSNANTWCHNFDDLNKLSWSDWSAKIDALRVCLTRSN